MQNPGRWIYQSRFRNRHRFSNWNRNLPHYINRKPVVVPDMKFFRECVIEGEQKQTDINEPRLGISRWNERYKAYIEAEAKRLKVSVEEVITHESFKHPTLSFADIPHDKLHPLNLSGINLVGIRFKDREVNDVNFTGAILDYAEFQYWDVTNVNFYDASLYRTNFEDALLQNVRFPMTRLIETRFRHARLNNCSFLGSILIDINFSNSNLNSVDFSKSLIVNCEYSYSIQENVEYADSAIYNCQFEYVSINHSNFISADISPLDKDQIALIRNKSPSELHGDELKGIKDMMLNIIQSISDSSLTEVPLTSFVNSKLTNIQCDNTNLLRCSFGKVIIDYVSFKSAKIIKCIFAGTELSHSDFSFANILSTDYVQSSQTNTNYHFSKIINCFFTTSSLTNVRVYGAHLIHINSLKDVENVIKIYEEYYDYDIEKQINSDDLRYFLTKWKIFIEPYIAYDSERTTPSNEPIGFSLSELRNVDYSAAILLNYDVSLSSMYDCMFREAHLSSCNFGKTNTISLHFQQAKISRVDFREAKLADADFSHSKGIDRCRFDGADLTNADFSHSERINECSFNEADLTNASFAESKVSDCEFTNTSLSHTVLPDNYDWDMFCKGHRFTIPAHSFNVELIALSVILIGLTIPMTVIAFIDLTPTGIYPHFPGFEIVPLSNPCVGIFSCTLILIAVSLLVYPICFIVHYERYRIRITNDWKFLQGINRSCWITVIAVAATEVVGIFLIMRETLCIEYFCSILAIIACIVCLTHMMPERAYFKIYGKSSELRSQEKKKD